MIKKSFLGLMKPKLCYESIGNLTDSPVQIPSPSRVTLFAPVALEQKDLIAVQTNDEVKTGQKISPVKGSDAYVISPITGKITSISRYIGNFGQSCTAITIEAGKQEELDNEFKDNGQTPSAQSINNFLQTVPGSIDGDLFGRSDRPIETIVVCCADDDLLVTTNQFISQSKPEMVKKGIDILKNLPGIKKIILAIPENLAQAATPIGGHIVTLNATYPSFNPYLIMKNYLGQTVPAGKTCEDLGVAFLSAESVASVGSAYTEGQIPSLKVLDLIDKTGKKHVINAKIGTPVKDILDHLKITINDQDRIIFGGPLTGFAIYTTDHPVEPDTNAIMIQSSTEIPHVSDYPCINCGECIRICPAKIPVNMLIRFLEAGQYEDAQDQYDLDSCIECGLCSYVCISRMPIFQYIRLAKYELARTKLAEAANE